VERRAPVWLIGAAGFAACALLVGALVGPVSLGVGGVLRGTFAHVLGLHNPLSPSDDAILWQVRLPRVVLGGIVGATLALAGAAYQGVFRNPLADPYLLGAAAGSGIGAPLALILGRSGGIS
jgi:iron complex transport system permease protein